MVLYGGYYFYPFVAFNKPIRLIPWGFVANSALDLETGEKYARYFAG